MSSRVVSNTLAVAINNAVVSKIDGADGHGRVEIKNSGGKLLSTLPLASPCGTVDTSTGELSINFGPRDDEAEESGTADIAELKDASGKMLLSLPVSQGSSSVPNTCVISSKAIVAGAPVEGVSFVIAGGDQ